MFRKSLGIFFLLAFILTSCKKQDNNVTIPLGMSALVNGSPWNSNNNSAIITNTGSLVLSCTQFNTSDSILVSIYLDTCKIGIHQVSGIYGSPAVISWGSYSGSITFYKCEATSGVITLTSVSDTNVQGTFNGFISNSNSYSVTNGEFNLRIQ